MPLDGTGFDPVTRRLILARERVEAGWCQGTFRTNQKEYCMLGAIGFRSLKEITDSFKSYRSLRFKTMMRLQDALGHDWSIIAWQDKHRRTKEEVLAIFDKALTLVG